MISLLWALFTSPGAESDPSDWATRMAAHAGVALPGWIICMWIAGDAVIATAMAALLYAIWEAGQFILAPRRSWPLAWDCALDWCAWTLMAVALAGIWSQSLVVAGLACAALFIAMAAGIAARQ